MLETQGRTKFSGAVKSMTRTELVAEYLRLRDFLSAKTSTMQGIKNWKRNVYQSLVDRGFTGSQEELSELFEFAAGDEENEPFDLQFEEMFWIDINEAIIGD